MEKTVCLLAPFISLCCMCSSVMLLASLQDVLLLASSATFPSSASIGKYEEDCSTLCLFVSSTNRHCGSTQFMEELQSCKANKRQRLSTSLDFSCIQRISTKYFSQGLFSRKPTMLPSAQCCSFFCNDARLYSLYLCWNWLGPTLTFLATFRVVNGGYIC